MKLRKMIAAVLTAAMVLSITGCSNNEALKRMEKEVGVFEFDNDGDCAILSKYDGDASEVQIPAYKKRLPRSAMRLSFYAKILQA